VTQAQSTLAELQRNDAERTRNEALMQSVLPWLEYDAPLHVQGSQRTVTVLGSYSGKLLPDPALEQAGAYVEPISADDNGRYLAITYHKDDRDAVERVLLEFGFVKTAFPEIELTAQAAYDRAERRLAELEEEVVLLNDKLMGYADFLDDIEILSDVEETTVNVCLQKQRLLKTKNCIVLEGWIPEVRTEAVTEALSHFECACEIAAPEEDDEPPVLLKNNSFSGTFEWVIGMYSYPKYGTYDPTVVMSIFYFLIFGMMFADVGYGLLLVLGCFGGIRLLNPKPAMRQMMTMFGYCGIACMLMGVLFGGWFGDLPTAIMDSFIYHEKGVAATTPIGSFFYYGLILNPVESSTSFLVIALAMGEIHLIAGMVINMIETWKKGRAVEALCTSVPFWILFIGLDMLVPSAVSGMLFPEGVSEEMTALFAQLASIGGYVTVAGFASIFLFNGVGQKSFFGWLVKGLGGLYSLISLASDLLSYSRILALGLVASVIAQVINMLTGLGATGPFGFVFMLIVMILGHVLNLAINLLGTFVHAARLQYIEFFGKFYEDGGEPFSPALPAENYSEDCKDVPN
jgi:V/A-type H+-transporting ATPase subunit I